MVHPCKHPTCDRFTAEATTMCHTHKRRKFMGQDMDAPIKRLVPYSATLEERFYRLLGPTPGEDECWIWPRSVRQSKGVHQIVGNYGRMGIGGNRSDYAHRVSYQIHHGEIPSDLHVLHSCDNPPCVNPAHLRLGTQSDNISESVAKGRHYTPFS
jgi:hypothetical protein